jgi:hypothetical protein
VPYAKKKQGLELVLGRNVVGHFLFAKLILPYLVNAAKSSPPSTVRVIFYGSSIIELCTSQRRRILRPAPLPVTKSGTTESESWEVVFYLFL